MLLLFIHFKIEIPWSAASYRYHSMVLMTNVFIFVAENNQPFEKKHQGT